MNDLMVLHTQHVLTCVILTFSAWADSAEYENS